MEKQNYYRNPLDSDNNVSDNSRYLIVNCAGCCVLPYRFRSYQPNGRNDYYIMYLTAGNLSVSSGARNHHESLLLRPGQLFVFPPCTSYLYENETGDEIRYCWIHFTGYGAAGLLSDCRIPLGAPRQVGFPADAEEKYRALFKCFVLREACFDTVSASKFMDICAMFGRMIADEDACSGALRPQAPAAGRIYTSLSYLHENFSSPLSVGALAEMEHLGVSRYRALFREITGTSPLAYITGLRLRRAAELLSQTNLPMADIALSVGYEDPQYFSRIFKAERGISPAGYRKQHKKEMKL